MRAAYDGPVSILDRRTRDDPRRAATERALLDATQQLLEEGESFAQLSVTRIADRAGRPRTAFYAHFPDRRALLLALMGEAGVDSLHALAPFFGGSGRADHEDVRRGLEALLGAFRMHAALVRAVIDAAGYDAVIAERWEALVADVIDGAAARLERHGLTDDDARATATALVWMTERVLYLHAVRQRSGLDDQAVLGALDDAWWGALTRH